jgi:ATP-binding cassette subfamily B protein
MSTQVKEQKVKAGLWQTLGPYRGLMIILIVLAVLGNAFTLWLPKLLSEGIDGFAARLALKGILWEYALVSVGILLLTYAQNVVQTYVSEKVARDLRKEVSDKIATISFAEVEAIGPAKLLTNLTSDIDAIKNFVAQAVASLVSSIFLIVGGSYLLLVTDWQLALAVLTVLPIIGGSFFVIFGKVRALFLQSREVIDWLNKVVNESILGAALIRVLNLQKLEEGKFAQANAQARTVSMKILALFSAMIPIVTFASNLAILIILVLGGKFIINGDMTLGDFAAFNSYLTILIFPIFILGFMSSLIAQAQAAYERINAVLQAPVMADEGKIVKELTGVIEVENLNLSFDDKRVLCDINLTIKPKTKVAIIGPTAAGKTQLLNLLIGLTRPTSGEVKYDGERIANYQREALYKQIGLVFQDSIIFNISLRENIAFNTEVKEEDLQRAIRTAELTDFIGTLPEGLATVVSERGASLSGGQKQRIMLARALAINPKILLLDDFTARVDASTEKKILANISENYPELTLVSVTQKIEAVEDYDQLIVLMEGEIVAKGTHRELMHSSPDYVQIYNSQQSTNAYEL